MARRDVAVWVGGAVGTVARAGVAELVPLRGDSWPWATLAVNLLGTVLLAVLVVWVADHLHPEDLRLRFLATGLLGSFTTFSAFAVEVRVLGPTGRGLTYGVVSVLVGMALVSLATRWTRRLVHR